MKIFHYYIFYSVLLLCIGSAFSSNCYGQKSKKRRSEVEHQTIKYENYIYEDKIRTVQFYQEGNELSFPVMYFGKNIKLKLSFDELSNKVSDFYVTFVHCDAEWQPDNLLPIEFYDGITYDQIFNYQHSQNTLVPYIHYNYTFPAQGGNFKLGGNYLLKVYRDRDEDKLVLTRRFVVAEDLLKVIPDVGISSNTAQRFRMQAVNFNLLQSFLKINDPQVELKVQVLQNFRWDNLKKDLQPAYIYPDGRMEYRFDASKDFEGGNEFRWFDTRTIRQRVGRLYKIYRIDSITGVELDPDRPRTTNAYLSEPDFNGLFFIGIREAPMKDVEADYVNVRISLLHNDIIEGENVYLFGQMTEWRALPAFQLKKLGTGVYATDVLLKQGVYNYQYIVTDEKGKIDEQRLEGSHFETENFYTILVYYRAPVDRTDRLVGIKHINFYENR